MLKTYSVELITAESEASRHVRRRRLIRFPQLTMPLIAAYTPGHWNVSHTDEIVQRVDFDKKVDLVGITANTPAAPHAYRLASEYRRRNVTVVIGGPHATLMPQEVALHADAVVVGEAELTWPQLLRDYEQGVLKKFYRPCQLPDLRNAPRPRWDLIKGRVYGKGVTIATRGCPFNCDYCTIPAMYQRRMRYRPIPDLVDEIRHMPGRALIFWDDHIGANKKYAKALFKAITPLKRWWTSQATADVAFDDEFMSLAARSGCKALFIGLESISKLSPRPCEQRAQLGREIPGDRPPVPFLRHGRPRRGPSLVLTMTAAPCSRTRWSFYPEHRAGLRNHKRPHPLSEYACVQETGGGRAHTDP